MFRFAFPLISVNSVWAPGASRGSLLKNVVRKRQAKPVKACLFVSVSCCNLPWTVGSATLSLVYVVILHQLAPAEQDGVPRHQPGEDPLEVDDGSVQAGDPSFLHILGCEQLDDRLKFEAGQ